MRYVAAYLLASLGSKDNPATSDIEKILSSVGIECDAESAKKVVSQLNNKSVDDILKEGMGKLASMPSGGGGAAPAAAEAAPEAKKAEKKEEKKKEESEEEDDDMGFGLFD